MKRALTVVALWASSARGDVLHATREQPLVEVAHTVDVRIDGGVATYKVRRMFANPGKVADEAGLAIDLPAGAAATGLRIRAHDVWYDGELMERDKAAALYHELTGLGAYKPKDPALLQWLWADKLYLQVFPVMPGGVSTVEYTLTVPTRYESGRYWISYPRVEASRSTGDDREGKTLALATPVITIHPAWGTSTTPISVDGKRALPDTPIALVPPVHEPWEVAVGAEASASYVSSVIAVPASSRTQKTFAKATVVLDIAHTYKGDLRVELLTPEGKSIKIHDRTGGGDNNIKGKFPIELPPGTHTAGTWRLVVSDHAGLDTGSIDGWQLVMSDGQTFAAADTPVFVPDAPENASDAGVATIAVAPPAIDTWLVRLGRVVASDKHAFGRLEVDVAPELRPVPKHAQVVFAIDASYSIGERGLAAQLDIARAYLTHVPDAEVELVAYRRHAQRVFGKFVPAKAFAEALAAHPIALGNGSALDEAERLAATALAKRPGPHRLVIATDELVRPALTEAQRLAALSALSPETVVHVVIPHVDLDSPALDRDDAAPFAPLATRHHGILAQVRGVPNELKELAPVMLELVRPTRIDQLTVAGFAVDDKLLREGDGLRIMTADKTAPPQVVLAGKLWSDPVRRVVTPTETFTRATAAFVFGADEHHELSHAEMMTVALLGRAVSPVTSYVAFEPGTRPSTIGLPGYGTGSGSGYGDGMGAMQGRAIHSPPDLGAMIDPAACVAQVKPAATWHVELDVDTTKDEIVDVTITGGDAAMARCLVETVWAVRLDNRFDQDHESFHVRF